MLTQFVQPQNGSSLLQILANLSKSKGGIEMQAKGEKKTTKSVLIKSARERAKKRTKQKVHTCISYFKFIILFTIITNKIVSS